MALRIGMHTGVQDVSYPDLRKLWQIADSNGFYWVSVWDHFYENPTQDGKSPCFEATTTMAAIAAETENVRIGCLVMAIGYRNPALLAKATVTIDHISNGRVEMGIGGGWYEMEFLAYGYPFPPIKTRLDQLEEGAQIIRSMLHNESTTFHGKHYSVDNAYLFPRPIQTSPRLWIGGLGEKRTLRITAKYADGWNAAYVPPEMFAAKSQILDQWCEKECRDPASITRSVNLGFYMGTDEADARKKHDDIESAWGGDPTYKPGGMLFGTAAQVRDRIGEYVDIGVTDLNIAFRAPFDFDAVQSFIEEVMPAFK